MKFVIAIMAIYLLSSTATIAQEVNPESWESAYSKRNVQLGITLEEFREIPFPDPSEHHHVVPTPVCSNDEIDGKAISMGYIADFTGYDKVGVIKCGYYGSYKYMVNSGQRDPSLVQISPYLVDWFPDANYYFYKPEGFESYYLFHIKTESRARWPYDVVLDALQRSIGVPTQQLIAMGQNEFGMAIESNTSIWENEVSRIKLVSNNGRLLNNTLDHELLPLLALVKAQLLKLTEISNSRL